MDPRVFDQTETWVDADGIAHRIDELSDGHLFNVIEFLVTNPEFFLREYARFAHVGDVEPLDWVEGTPVMKALRDEATARGIEVPGCG